MVTGSHDSLTQSGLPVFILFLNSILKPGAITAHFGTMHGHLTTLTNEIDVSNVYILFSMVILFTINKPTWF